MLFGCLLFYYDLFNSFQIALKSYVIRKTNQKNLRRILRLVSNEPCFCFAIIDDINFCRTYAAGCLVDPVEAVRIDGVLRLQNNDGFIL